MFPIIKVCKKGATIGSFVFIVMTVIFFLFESTYIELVPNAKIMAICHTMPAHYAIKDSTVK